MAMEVHWDLSSNPGELTLRTDIIAVFAKTGKSFLFSMISEKKIM